MHLFYQGIVFGLGTMIGSFLNVVILRFGTPASVVWDRSRCTHCHQVLRWWELLPVISWVMLRGKCQRCHQPIAWQYPLIEALTGLLFLIISITQTSVGLPIQVVTGAIACVLIVLAVIDLKTFLLPDYLVLVLAGFVLIHLWLMPPVASLQIVGGVLIGAGFLFLLWAVTRGQGLGFGDVKLMIPLGALFGIVGTVTLLFLAFCLGGALGTVLLLRGKAAMKTAIPFGPFLAGIALLILLWPALPLQLWGLLLW